MSRHSWRFFLCLLGGVHCTLHRKTQYGDVLGTTDDNDPTLGIWHGIPFAADPVGALRWKPPQPAIPWSSVKHLGKSSTMCVQADFGPFPDNLKSNPLSPPPDTKVQGTEACLTLDVWGPQNVTEASNLPVLVYLFGGGFVVGSTDSIQNQPANLVSAANYRLVVVQPNYRLGGLGFMGWDYLVNEEGSHGSSGNYGTFDQIAALNWVQNNIRNFGGDPQSVTLMGESAGAMSVTTLLASPLAKGLFSRASALSSLTRSQWTTQAVSQIAGQWCADKHNCTDSEDPLACLRDISAADAYYCTVANSPLVTQAQTINEKIRTLGVSLVGPNIDNYLLYDSPQHSIQQSTAGGRPLPAVPVLIGSNTDEQMAFTSLPVASNLWNLSDSQLESAVGASLDALLYRSDPTLPLTATGIGTPALVSSLLELYPKSEFQAAADLLDLSLHEQGGALNFLCSFAKKVNVACHSDVFSVNAKRFSEIHTDLQFTATASGVCNAQFSRNLPCWKYAFNQSTNGPNSVLGATHGSNLPYVFGTLDKSQLSHSEPAPTINMSTLEANMMNFWINFITTGDPNGNRRDVLPEWPKVSSAILAQQQYMLLNQPGLSSGMGYRSDKLSLLAQVESLAYRYKQAPILPSSSSSDKLSGGAMLAIILSCGAVATALIVGALYYSFKRRRDRKQEEHMRTTCAEVPRTSELEVEYQALY